MFLSALQKWMFPDKDELPEQLQMPIWDHLEELRERVLISGLACAAAILTCFVFSKVTALGVPTGYCM